MEITPLIRIMGSLSKRVLRRPMRMFVGKVVGDIWATKKVENLRGFKLLLIEPLKKELEPDDPREQLVVAADNIGAGIGEYVVVAYGRAGRNCLGMGHDIAVEAAVAGIVDKMELARNGLINVVDGGGEEAEP